MNEKNLIIICLSAIICVSIICGTLIVTSNQNKISYSTIDLVNNTTENDNNTTNIGISIKKTTYKSDNTQNSNSKTKKQSSSTYSKKKDTVNGGAKDIGGDYYQTPDGKIHYGAKYYDHPGDDSDYD